MSNVREERGEGGHTIRAGAEGWTNMGGGGHGRLKTVMHLDALNAKKIQQNLSRLWYILSPFKFNDYWIFDTSSQGGPIIAALSFIIPKLKYG